jgi:hypothetical protein
MARRRGLIIAGLAAGAYAYFKNPENRRKATIAFNNAKVKVNDFMESQNLEGFGEAETTGSSAGASPSTKKKNDGTSTSVQYYNEDKKSGAETSGSTTEKTNSENFGRTDSDTPESKSHYSDS